MELLEELKSAKTRLEKEIDSVLIDYKKELREVDPKIFDDKYQLNDYLTDKNVIMINKIKRCIEDEAKKYDFTIKTSVNNYHVYSLVYAHLENELIHKRSELNKINEDYLDDFLNTQPL